MCKTYDFYETFAAIFMINNLPVWFMNSFSCILFSQPANILLDEHGHVRISDLGLACDFSKKKPHASV